MQNMNVSNMDFETEFTKHFRESRLLQTRTIFMSEAVGSGTAKRIVADLLTLDQDKHDPIYFIINSPGGEVNSGFAIFDTVRFIQSKVMMINAGLCASIATIINIAVPKERRFSLPNTRFLIHQPLISGQVYGQASDIEITANEILKTRAKINSLLASECGKPLARVEEDTTRDFWMDANEALDYGLIGRVVTNRKEVL